MKQNINTIRCFHFFLCLFLWSSICFSQATFEVKTDGKVQMDHVGDNILEFIDGSTLKGYIKHDGTNLRFYNESGTVILGTNGTNRLHINQAGGVKIGGGSADSKAALDIAGSGKGILIPRTDTTAFVGMVSDGMLIYDITLGKFAYYTQNKWVVIGSSNLVSDTDLDTKVDVEKTSDEDVIRFTIGGVEHFSMDSTGHLDVLNTGGSVFIGEHAGKDDDMTDNRNVGIGTAALEKNINGSNSVAIGDSALFSNTSYYQTAIGAKALRNNSTGSRNTATGYKSLYNNTTGSRNTAIGRESLLKNDSGENNTAIGYLSLGDNVIGGYNVAVGSFALEHNIASHNVAIGAVALRDNIIGENNSALGADAGKTNVGNNNLFLGTEAGRDNQGSGNIFIGYQSGKSAAGDNLLYIDNSDTIAPLIKGDFENDSLTINGNLVVTGNLDVTSIDVSKITGILGSGYSAVFPVILDNTVLIEIEGLFVNDVLITSTIGYEIDTFSLPGAYCLDTYTGLSQEFPLTFETDNASDISELLDWFANPYPKSMSVVIQDVAENETARYNFIEYIPGSTSSGSDGRTSFTLVNNLAPNNSLQIQTDSDFGDSHSYNPDTDKLVEIPGVVVYDGFTPAVQVDYDNRVITLEMTYNEGSGLQDWIKLFVNGIPDLRSMSIIETTDGTGNTETSRENFFEVAPFKYEVIYGFGLNTKLKARIQLLYGCNEPG